MEKVEWENLFQELINKLREQTFVPYDTGNLKLNALKGIWVDDDIFRIYIDESIAPYVFYTNEKWINRPGKNPNENWVDKAKEFIVEFIKQRLGGEVEK